jgi:hypothetical protein
MPDSSGPDDSGGRSRRLAVGLLLAFVFAAAAIAAAATSLGPGPKVTGQGAASTQSLAASLTVSGQTLASGGAAGRLGAPSTAGAVQGASGSSRAGVPGHQGASVAQVDLGDLVAAAPVNRVARERAHQSGVSLEPSASQPYWACPRGVCEAIVDPPARKVGGHWMLPDSARALEGSGEKGGYAPADLQSAYGVTLSGGEQEQHYEEGLTIALVDVGYDPQAESDLAEYRHRYGLPACTNAGGCFHQVNEEGHEGNPPPVNPEWNLETSLDLDMASAMCPHCHILLAESSRETLGSLAVTANSAAALGAFAISNSYGLPENPGEEPEFPGEERPGCGTEYCRALDTDYNQPGRIVTVSAGDAGYNNYLRGGHSPLFPAVSSTVIAVGGTALHKAEGAGRKWSESVWWEPGRSLGTGSGCSGIRQKPSWQQDSGCAFRTDNDVSAVAACETPVSIYSKALGGWENVCGTSVSSPLVAGIEVHVGEAAFGLGELVSVPTAYPFYKRQSQLYNVTKGRDDSSCSPEYLCSAETQEHGYDGPAGNGTPANGHVATGTEPPSVRTEPASSVVKGAVTINGVIDPNNAATSYRFEYGPTAAYGTSAPSPEGSAGSGSNVGSVSTKITVSQPATYHFRLAATNSNGTAYGEDRTFAYGPSVTAVSPPTGSAKGGTPVTIQGAGFKEVNAVKFGASNAASFTVNSETSITAVAPPGHGVVDVTVTTPIGTTQATTADQFSYTVAQQLAKLIGSETVGSSALGWDVALSADGNTALAAGYHDNGETGAAWVFTRSGSKWAQQGPKLTGGEEVAAGEFGWSAAISADGNTALIGGPNDNQQTPGAAWFFTRAGSSWHQQGAKVAGPPAGGTGVIDFGIHVALSGDGNTALISGDQTINGNQTHVVWVLVRSGSTWTQQAQLIGPLAFNPYFGTGDALSYDGNTAIIGAPGEGSAWIFTRSGSTWSKQAQEYGPGLFGGSVALSADGATALVGTGVIGSGEGETASVFTRSGTTWSKQAELPAGGEVGKGFFGESVALSAEGNVALVGGPYDSGQMGAAWLYTRSGSTWTQAGGKLTGASQNLFARFGQSVALSASGGIALVGGPDDTPEAPEPNVSGIGAAWVFATDFPTVAKVEPNHGPTSGGTSVTITGTNFTGATEVHFGSAKASSFSIGSETTIHAVPPPGSGTVAVSVTTPEGTSPTSAGDTYTYVPVENVEYTNWVLSGSVTDKKMGQPITLPAGSTFNGHGELNTETGAGTVSGNLAVPPFATRMKLFGLVTMILGLTVSQGEPLQGTVVKSTSVPGEETLSIPAKLNVGITSLTIFGLELPLECTTSEPFSPALSDNLTVEELLRVGWSFSGTATLPGFKCGGFLGPVATSVFSMLLSGPENAYSLSIRAPGT